MKLAFVLSSFCLALASATNAIPFRNLQDDVSTTLLADKFDNKPGFYHSVASGDPLPDAVIVWTRYTPKKDDETVEMELRMAAVDMGNPPAWGSLLDPVKNDKVQRFKVTTDKESDFTAKIDVKGLAANQHYAFAFIELATGATSDVGLTRTAPVDGSDVESLNYAVFYGGAFSNGYFHAYDAASTIKNLDLWIHVGGYYYSLEFGLLSSKFSICSLLVYLFRSEVLPLVSLPFRAQLNPCGEGKPCMGSNYLAGLS